MHRTLPIVAMCLLVVLAMPVHADSTDIGPFEAQDLAEMAHLGKAAEAVVGSGWRSDARIARSLVGWKGRVNGEAITFTNDRLKADGAAATFRITRTNWEPLDPDGSSGVDSDIALSVSSHGYWYCCPGTFGKAYPARWKKTLTRLRGFFGLPEANDGIVCLLEKSMDIFPVGAPIDLGVRVQRLSGPTHGTVYDDPQYLVVTDSAGKRLPLLTPSHPELRSAVTTYGMIRGVERDFSISTPGIYKISLLYPLDKPSTGFGKSQEISVHIVPKDFIALRLRRLSYETLVSGRSVPVELELKLKDGDLSRFSELNMSYSASRTERNPAEHSLLGLAGLYGSPGRRMSEDIMGKLQPIGNGSYKMRFDLAAGYWNGAASSAGPCRRIRDIVKSGDTWWISVSVSGAIDGRRFGLSSNELAFQ